MTTSSQTRPLTRTTTADAVVDAVTDAVTHANFLTREKPRGETQHAEKRETATESPYAGTDRREYK